MDLEAQTRENTKAISDLANTVTKLVTTVEITEKQRGEDRQDTRKIFEELKTLNEKMNSVPSLTEKFANLFAEVGKLRHDIHNIQQGQQAIPLLKDSHVKSEKAIADHETRINLLEKWKDNTDGVTGAVKIIIHCVWAFVSVGGLSFIAWLAIKFTGGHIGGE